MASQREQIVAQKIRRVLEYLKDNKINQCAIENRLNYTSLSKAKNIKKYPQKIIERKTRSELLDELLDEYGLEIVEQTDEIIPKEDNICTKNTNNTIYYIMYYYAFLREVVDKAIVKIINKKEVVIDYRLDEHWEGTYEIIENYTFIQLEKLGGTTPVKKLICLFTGTEKFGRPILIGTYSTVKRDGFPAAGKILFEKIKYEKDIENKIKNDVDPRIAFFLKNKVFVSESFTPNSIDELDTTYKLHQRYSGLYYFLYPKNNDQHVKAELVWKKDSQINLVINKITYKGYAEALNNHSFKLEVKDRAGFSNLSQDSIIIFINMAITEYDPYYPGVGISNILETNTNSFKCLIVKQEYYSNNSENIFKSIKDCNIVIK